MVTQILNKPGPLYLFTCVLLIIFLTLTPVHADSKGVFLEVSPSSGSINDVFTLSVRFENEVPTKQPVLIGGEDFQQGYIGPQNNVFIDGATIRRTLIHTYRLIPKRVGTLKTPSVQVDINNKPILLESIPIEISEAPSVQYYDNDDVILQQSIDREVVYLGEQLNNSVEIYQNPHTPLSNMQLMDLTFDGFWHRSSGNDQRFRRIVRGKPYDVIRIRRSLYPMQTGVLEIPARELKARMSIRETRRELPRARDMLDSNIFDQSFFDHFFTPRRIEEVLVKSNQLNVKVNPLPPLPTGSSTWNLPSTIVGQTSLKVDYSAGSIEVGESKSLTIEVSSLGNLAALNKIPLNGNNSFRIYQDRTEETFSEENNKIVSTKRFKYSLVPTKPGEIRLPGLKLTYFDPLREEYRTLETTPISFHVTGSAETEPLLMTQEDEQETQSSIETDRLTYVERSLVERVMERFSLSMLLLIISASAFLIMLIGFIWKTCRSNYLPKDLLEKVNNAQNSAEIYQVIKNHLASVWRLSAGSLSSNQLKSHMKSKLHNADLVFRLQSIVDKLDKHLYQGVPDNERSLKELKEEIKEILPHLR